MIPWRESWTNYGKFFGKKSAFVSLEWFPVFANYRRDGYDFDARWDDELANIRSKKIMDCFEEQDEYIGLELKRHAGFGKGGEKNFNGILTDLQMQTYLVIKDFRRKVNKRGGDGKRPLAIARRQVEPPIQMRFAQGGSMECRYASIQSQKTCGAMTW